MSKHRLTVVTTADVVFSPVCDYKDAMSQASEIITAVETRRVVGIFTEEGYRHFNTMQLVHWGAEEVQE